MKRFLPYQLHLRPELWPAVVGASLAVAAAANAAPIARAARRGFEIVSRRVASILGRGDK